MSELLNNLIVVVHNISSVHRVVEFARLVTGLGLRYIVYTKVTGAAAQQGIPEAFRIAVKQGATLLVLSDLPDVFDLIRPDKAYFLITETVQGREIAKLTDIVSEISRLVEEGRKVALIVNGSDLPFTPRELQSGVPVKVLDAPVPSLALLAVTLYEIVCRGQRAT